jgi:hypothetical protein
MEISKDPYHARAHRTTANASCSVLNIVQESLAGGKASSEQFSVGRKEQGRSRRCCHGDAMAVDGRALWAAIAERVQGMRPRDLLSGATFL